MPTVTFNVTAANLTLLKEALAFHQGVPVKDISNADLQTWGSRQYQALAQKYRESQRDATNPVDATPVVS